MIAAFLILAISFVLINYSLKINTINKLKKAIADEGGELIELSLEFNFLSRYNNDYRLIYYDKKGKLIRSKVIIEMLDYTIVENDVLKGPEASKYLKNEEALPPPADKIFFNRVVNTSEGEILIEQTGPDIEPGDRVFLNQKQAPAGKYKLGFLHYIYVKHGRVC